MSERDRHAEGEGVFLPGRPLQVRASERRGAVCATITAATRSEID